MLDVFILSITALLWVLSVIIGTCHPNQERPLIFKSFKAIVSNAEVTCSPEESTTSYSEDEANSEVFFTNSTKLLVTPDIADTTTITLLPLSTSDFILCEIFLI